MKQLNTSVNNAMWAVYFKLQQLKEDTKQALSNKDGDAYIDTVVKILIAVVVGALLLWGLYALTKDTVLPTLVEKIKELFAKTDTSGSGSSAGA